MKASIDQLNAKVRASLDRPALDEDFDAELAHHLELLTQEKIQNGVPLEEARRQAQIALGGLQQLRESHRRARGFPRLEDFFRDVAQAVRLLRKERGFAAVALLVLAVGIGLNTTVFSLVNTVLLRPVPFNQPDRLVWVTNGDAGASRLDLSAVTSQIDTWEDLSAVTQTLEKLEGYNPFSASQTFRLTGQRDPETIVPLEVTSGLFQMLGVKARLGRLFQPEDSVKNAPLRTVLSDQIWRRVYNADPKIIGQITRINDQPVEIIGVLEPGDAFTSVFFPAVRIDLFRALPIEDERSWGNTLALIGRLKPGVTTEAAAADLSRAAKVIKQKHPERYFSANLMPLHEFVSGNLRRPMIFLWIAAGAVLAIVTLNIGGLLLARGSVRRKELALRVALGATRGRIVRQLMTDCFVLAAAGSILGALLSWGLIHYLSLRSAIDIPLLRRVNLDGSSLIFTILLCVLAVWLCGAAPAWKMVFQDEIGLPLREEGRGSSAGRLHSRTRAGLVTVEIALACILLISASLVVRSFLNLLKVDLGFAPRHLIAVRIDPIVRNSMDAYLDQMLLRVRAIPGVEQAAVTDCIPVEHDRSWSLYPVNAGSNEQHWTGAHVRLVSSNLFSTMQTTLLSGRDFVETDSGKNPGVMIINQSLAKASWPNENALGKQIMIMGTYKFQVVGIVADVRHDGPEFPAGNEMYFSFAQISNANSWDLLVRTNLSETGLTTALQSALREFDPTLPLTKVRAMDKVMERTLSSRKMLVSLIVGFAVIALILALVGLYGVISYMVAQQTREIGIRMALGAEASTVLRYIVGATARLTALGLALGALAAAFVSRAFQSILFGVASLDVPTYLIGLAVLLICALLAGYFPARRASRVDPLIALRAE